MLSQKNVLIQGRWTHILPPTITVCFKKHANGDFPVNLLLKSLYLIVWRDAMFTWLVDEVRLRDTVKRLSTSALPFLFWATTSCPKTTYKPHWNYYFSTKNVAIYPRIKKVVYPQTRSQYFRRSRGSLITSRSVNHPAYSSSHTIESRMVSLVCTGMQPAAKGLRMKVGITQPFFLDAPRILLQLDAIEVIWSV